MQRYFAALSLFVFSGVRERCEELVLATLRQVGSIIAEHLEATTSDADEVVAQLVAVLDTQELADAINRLERGYGLRVVKREPGEVAAHRAVQYGYVLIQV